MVASLRLATGGVTVLFHKTGDHPDMTEKIVDQDIKHQDKLIQQVKNPFLQPGTFTNSEDPVEMAHNAAFHQGEGFTVCKLKVLQTKKWKFLFKIIT